MVKLLEPTLDGLGQGRIDENECEAEENSRLTTTVFEGAVNSVGAYVEVVELLSCSGPVGSELGDCGDKAERKAANRLP